MPTAVVRATLDRRPRPIAERRPADGRCVAAAEARADEAGARADAAAACARGYLSAIGGAFDAGSVSEGVPQAMGEIEALNASCSETLGS